MTAAEVKEALRKRHPAWSQGMVGEWTCLEEWRDVDLLAVSAWSRERIIGYEVKVSRSDYRRELLRPKKRALAVKGCHEFYFAVPEGLLKPDEIAFSEPEWEQGAFTRERCPGIPAFGPPVTRARRLFDESPQALKYGGPCAKMWVRVGGRRVYTVTVPVPTIEREATSGVDYVTCPTCSGCGYVKGSLVERTAPTLWVPQDVGLVVITSRGCKVVKKAPKNVPEDKHRLIPKGAAKLVRWASVRPDPRHRAKAAA